MEVRDLSFGYCKGVNVLSSVSLALERGERLAIIGRNGVGKTTLLHLLIGLKQARSGSIALHGEEVGYSRKELIKWRQKVAIVFQNPDDQVFAPTVEQDVSFGPYNLGLDDDEIQSRVTTSLQAMGIGDCRGRSPIYLSGGEKKRVAIAGALAMNPEVLLLDEPTSALDGDSRGLLEASLNRLSETGVSVVASTHDMDFAWRWAERIILLVDGGIKAEGSARRVLMNRSILDMAGLQQPLLAKLASLLQDRELSLQDARSAEIICMKIQKLVDERN
jgi:cobalt/nickel transport system ATP-binding protein